MSKWVLGLIALVVACVLFVYFFRDRVGSDKEWQDHDAKVAVLDQKMKAIATEMNAVGGHGKCIDDSDCRAIGLGPKTCGGYPTFLVYSQGDANEPRLLELARDFNAASKEANDLSMRVPGCGRATPVVRCMAKKCVSDGSGQAGG